MEKHIKITLVHSQINRPERQKKTIRGLGLTRLHQSRVVPDTTAIRGMIRKVSHLVRIEGIE